MKKGFTIVELLVVSVIMIVLATGLFYVYTRVFRVGTDVPLTIKSESELKVSILQVVRDLQGIGFGIPIQDRTKIVTDAYDGSNWHNMDNEGYVLSIKHSNGNSYVVFRSLMTRINDIYSGCIGVYDPRSKVFRTYIIKDLHNPNDRYRLTSIFGRSCPEEMSKYVFIQPSDPLQYKTPGGLNFLIGFYKDPTKPPEDYTGRLYLSTSTDTECAPGTYTLYRAEGSTSFPLITCVKSFRILFGVIPMSLDRVSYNYTFPKNTVLKTLRLCLIAQIGKKQDSQRDPPNFSKQCVSYPELPPVSFSTYDKYYRWKVFEMDIRVTNIMAPIIN